MIVVGGLVAALGAVGGALASAFDALRVLVVELAPFLTAGAVVAGGIWTALIVRAWIRRRRTAAFLDAARALAANPTPTLAEGARVSALRQSAAPLSVSATTETEGLYRSTVAEMVADQHLAEQERDRLDLLHEALGVPDGVARNAEVEGFLQVHAALVGDGRLTDKEEAVLTDLCEALRVPESAIQAQLGQTEQLRRARLVGSGECVPVEVGVKLRKGESCYYCAPYTEKKKRVAHTYQQDGVRYSEQALEDVKRGDLYVTSERVLLMSDGATNIKHEKIMDTAVETDSGLLVLTVDGRKTPYYFAVAEPFVVAAHIERAGTPA